MALNPNTRQQFRRLLEVVDDRGNRQTRLVEAANRLMARARAVAASAAQTTPAEPDFEAMELACLALQLPMRPPLKHSHRSHKPATLRERAEQSAELLASADVIIEEQTLERAGKLLHEMPQRSPGTVEARLVADAVNLDDFGISGLFIQAGQLARAGSGPSAIVENAEKREQYGYWEARLKDSFHFESSRDLATKRLAEARRVAAILAQELRG